MGCLVEFYAYIFNLMHRAGTITRHIGYPDCRGDGIL